MVAQVVQDSYELCPQTPPSLYPVRAPRGVSRCAPGITKFSLHLYNYSTGEVVNGPWREQKSDLGVLKK